MRKLFGIILLLLMASPLYAKDYAVEFPTGVALEVVTPTSGNATYLKLDQSTPQTTTGTFNLSGLDLVNSNITYVPVGDGVNDEVLINAYIAAATAGDTLVLASGLNTGGVAPTDSPYIIGDSINVTKPLHIIGQGRANTRITCNTDNKRIFNITASNVRIVDLSAYSTSVTTGDYVIYSSGGAGLLGNIHIDSCDISHTSTNGGAYGMYFGNTAVTLRDCAVSCTASTTGVSEGIFITSVNGNTSSKIYNANISSVGKSGTSHGVHVEGGVTPTVHIYDSKIACAGTGTTSYGISTNAVGTNVIVYGGTISGANVDLINSAGSIKLYNVDLVNGTRSGTITWDGEVNTEDLYVADDATIANGGTLQINSAGDDKNIQISHNDTNGLITSSDGTISLNDDNLISTGYVSCKNFTDSSHYTGFPDRTSTSLSWNDGAFTLTLTATSDPIWIKGNAYTINTLTKALTAAQELVSGLYWFWLTETGGVVSLNADTTQPGFDKCLVATVYWNTTTNKGLLSDERHWFGRDQWWHEWAHETIGARYYIGLTGTFADATLSVTAGEFYDEDMEHVCSDDSPMAYPGTAMTSCQVLYHNGDASWAWDTLTTPYKVVNPGVDSNLRYNNGNTLATADNNKYVNYWVFASADAAEPVHVVLGTNQYVTLALARQETIPSLGALPSAEEKIIYKITYQNNGGTPDYIETVDYRASSSLPIANYVPTSHSSLSNLTSDDHAQYWADTTIGSRTTSYTTTGTVTGEQLTSTDDATITDLLSYDESDWTGGNVIQVPLAGDIATYITAATAGDTLVLAAGTYTITAGLTVNKKLHIMGQGEGITTISCTTDLGAGNMIAFTTTDGSRISNMTLTYGAALSSSSTMISCQVSVDISNIQAIETCTGSTSRVPRFIGTATGGKTINIENCTYSGSGDCGAHEFLVNPQTNTVNIRNCIATSTGGDSVTKGNVLLDLTSAGVVNIYNSSFSSPSATSATGVLNHAAGTTSCYNSTFNGSGAGAFDVLQVTAGTLTLYNTTLVNNTTSGTITYRSWTAWTPSLVWGTGTPASITTVGRYTIGDGICYFKLYITSADSNGCSSLTATLPITPKDVNSYTRVSSLQLNDTTYLDPMGYIDQLDNTGTNRLLKFYSFATVTDGKTVTIECSGEYEL